MKVYLINQSPDTSKKLSTISLSSYTLKAYVEANISKNYLQKISIKVIDFDYKTTSSKMIDTILSGNPDIVGFSVYLWNYEKFCLSSEKIKSFNPSLTLMFGGPQLNSSETAADFMNKYPQVDIVSYVNNAGEIIFYNVLLSLFKNNKLKSVKGIVYRKNNDILINPPPTQSTDLSVIPSPYIENIIQINKPTHAVIETSRGCPFDCGYCSWGGGIRKIRYFPLKRVFKELDLLYENNNIESIYFADSNFFTNTKRSEIILDYMLKKKRNIEPFFEMDIRSIQKKIVQKFTKLNSNYCFHFALQSSNPIALKHIGGRRIQPDKFAQKISLLKKWAPKSAFKIDIMLGLPGDDLIGFKKTVDFALSLEPLRLIVNYPIYLLPGSKFYENRDNMNLKYTKKIPLTITETSTFSKSEMNDALKWVIWVEILTYYYPAISNFFYLIYKKKTSSISRTDQLTKWITSLNEAVSIYPNNVDLVDIATESLHGWNILKGDILRRSSELESAYKIFSTIYELEVSQHYQDMTESIIPSLKLLEKLKSNDYKTNKDSHQYVFSRFKDNKNEKIN